MHSGDDRRTRILQRFNDTEATVREAFRQIGIDIDDVDTVRELAADLYFLRQQRTNHQSRMKTVWTAVITTIISVVAGAASVAISTLVKGHS